MFKLFDRQIKGIAFDLEGTMVDLESAHHIGHLLTAKYFGIVFPKNNLDDVLQKLPHFIGGPRESVCKEIINLCKKTPALEDVIKVNKSFYQQQLSKLEIKPRRGLFKFLMQLKKAKIKTAIGSVTPEDEAEVIFTQSGLKEYFDSDLIVLQKDVSRLKPFPDVYLKTAKKMRVQPKNQLVFEDSKNGVLAARNSGSLAIGMPIYRQSKIVTDQLFSAGAIRVFHSWTEISMDALINLK